jgi:hypothetical protein
MAVNVASVPLSAAAALATGSADGVPRQVERVHDRDVVETTRAAVPLVAR